MKNQWLGMFIDSYVQILNIVINWIKGLFNMAIPATPGNVVVDATASNLIEVSWDNVAGETGFNLYVSVDDATYTLRAALLADVVSYDDWSVNFSTQYYYKISAFNGDGESALSAAQNDTTLAQSFKTVYFHQLGPFNYDANAKYRADSAKRFMKAIYGGGDSWLSYLHVDTDLRVDNAILFGPNVIDDSWRMLLLSNDLTFQKYDSGWVTHFPPDYAEISVVGNSVETAIAVAGTKVQVTIFDTDGPSNASTPDHTNDHITIVRAETYLIMVSATVNSVVGVASRFEMTVQKNNGAAAVGALHCDRNLGGGGTESGVISMSGLATLAINDTLEVWIENETNTQNYVIEDITLSIMQVS